MRSSAKRKPEPPPQGGKGPAGMPLGTVNYLYIALGALVIALSYAGMYLEKAVDGVFALYVAPFTLTGAYLWVLYAIFRRPKRKKP